MARTRLYEMSRSILESIALRELVESFVCLDHSRVVLVWWGKIVLWLHSFPLPFAKFSLLVLEISGCESKVSIFVFILSRSRVSCLLGVQVIQRGDVGVWSPQHGELRVFWHVIRVETEVGLSFDILIFREFFMHLNLRSIGDLKSKKESLHERGGCRC
jgi:hypothetical protein